MQNTGQRPCFASSLWHGNKQRHFERCIWEMLLIIFAGQKQGQSGS
jgi:hypothetical protein